MDRGGSEVGRDGAFEFASWWVCANSSWWLTNCRCTERRGGLRWWGREAPMPRGPAGGRFVLPRARPTREAGTAGIGQVGGGGAGPEGHRSEVPGSPRCGGRRKSAPRRGGSFDLGYAGQHGSRIDSAVVRRRLQRARLGTFVVDLRGAADRDGCLLGVFEGLSVEHGLCDAVDGQDVVGPEGPNARAVVCESDLGSVVSQLDHPSDANCGGPEQSSGFQKDATRRGFQRAVRQRA